MAILPFFTEAQSLIFSNSSIPAARTKLKNNSTQYTMTMYGGEFYIVGRDTSYQMFKAGGTNTFTGNINLPLTTTIGSVSGAEISYLDSLTSPVQVSFMNVAEMRTKRGKFNQKANLIGYYVKGDGGGSEVYWDNTSTATDNGGTVFQVTGVSTGRWIRTHTGTINVKWFGAKGDFNGSSGTNDRAAIQAAFDYAKSISNCTVIFPKGKFYGGNAEGTKAGNVHIALGDTVVNSANNITIEGAEAELYAGYEGRFIGIFGANKVLIKGLKMFGYAGGALSSARERDALITVNYYSKYVTIEDCYLTNSLGDCIYVGGSLVSGGQTGYTSKNIIIRNNTLKERYGDGTKSFLVGTKSRLAIAVIDAIDVKIMSNSIYGSIDLEPNVNGQYLKDIVISGNNFKNGNVTAQGTVGSSYWYDEPTNISGGSIIEQNVTITGSPGSPIVEGCSVTDNDFATGYINSANVYSFEEISSNRFQKGLIDIGFTSGSNYTNFVVVKNNVGQEPKTGETSLIKFSGKVYNSIFQGNIAKVNFDHIFSKGGTGGAYGDGGRCVFADNILNSGIDFMSDSLRNTLQINSILSSNKKVGSSNYNISEFSKVVFTESYTPLVSFTGETGTQTLNYRTYGGNAWFITIPASTNASITDITNETGEGQFLTIQSGTSSGGTLTFVHDEDKLRMRAEQNLVLAANDIVILENRAGIWFEVANSSRINADVIGTGIVSNTEFSYLDSLSSNAQAQFNGKQAFIAAGTTGQYWRGDKTWQTLDKTAVGLGNLDNTSDANKPVSTAGTTALNLKLNAANPSWTGTSTGTGGMLVGNGTATSSIGIDIANARTGDGTSFVDLIGDATYNDYGLRVSRSGTANGNSNLLHRGTGALSITASDAGSITFSTTATQRMVVTSGGRVGIGSASPTSNLQVVGLPTYADNTAALAGGLTAGAFYRTSTGVLMVTY